MKLRERAEIFLRKITILDINECEYDVKEI